ncbi:MAG: hypothetical protein N2049_10395 [Anaerolineales bacterium]|nr:hypothetical protein [Anaerolineales bacterium]MCX7609611.1 hypothetical protein [Anaerolineales bacterium]MDW8227852.1 hypothetical protein [Anaerolineales bacterium]
MQEFSRIVRTIRQAPWRIQRQWVGLLLLILVVVVLLSVIYLNVTVQATVTGREIQFLNHSIEENTRRNADLSTELAALTSVEAMRSRAEALGYQPVELEEVTYLIVPGYHGKPPVNLSVPSSRPSPSLLRPEYYETLFDWITRQIAVGVRP